MTWPDTEYVTYEYDLTNAMTVIRESGSTALANFAYDNLGRRTSLTRGNGVTTSYAFDAASRLETLTQNLAGTSDDLTRDFTYNPAAQIIERESSNAAYDTPEPYNGVTDYTPNGLNQYRGVTQAQPGYDSRGNLTNLGYSTYSYDIFNRLTSATPAGAGESTFAYDALGRLRESVAASVTTRFLYDGVQVIGEFDDEDDLLRRYVFGPGINEPLVQYEGDDLGDPRWLLGDERGSIIAVTNGSGAATSINAYDEYGVPASSNVGTFQYTGQMWLPGARLYNYRARAYSAELGRFMQTDPIGFAGGMNLYAYVGNDPVDLIDPFGLQDLPIEYEDEEEVIVTCDWFCRFLASANQLRIRLQNYPRVLGTGYLPRPPGPIIERPRPPRPRAPEPEPIECPADGPSAGFTLGLGPAVNASIAEDRSSVYYGLGAGASGRGQLSDGIVLYQSPGYEGGPAVQAQTTAGILFGASLTGTYTTTGNQVTLDFGVPVFGISSFLGGGADYVFCPESPRR